MENYPVSVNLVVYHGAPWLPWCLESLGKQTYENFFLLIIDNGSIDKSFEICQQFLNDHTALAKRTRLVKNKHNVGFARGHNQAFSWTKSDYLLVLNQDVYLMPDYLAELVRCLMNEERAAAVTGKLLNWPFDSATFHVSALAAPAAPRLIDSAGLEILRSRKVVNLGQGETDQGQFNKMRRIFGVPATAPLYRRAALAAVSPQGKLFDEDFISYKEDVDLAWRLAWADGDAWLVPQALAYHDRSLNQSKGWRSEFRLRQGRPRDLKVYSLVNHLGVLVKNESWLNLLKDLPWVLAHELAKCLFLLVTDPVTLIQGQLRFWHLLPRFLKKRAALKPSHRRHYQELRAWWTRTKVAGQKI